MEIFKNKQVFVTILVAALGYMVDIYDLILFSVVRVQSLKDIGLTPEQIKAVGAEPLEWQMYGMLLGGLLWGIMGDKLGRLSVLFGSILLYSVANAANAFVYDLATYEWLRFIAGIGLAGELGAGITLVSEVMSKEKRGIGTTIVASIGVAGAVLAYFVSVYFNWRNAYLFGAVMGLALLLMRVSIFESGMFRDAKNSHVSRGNLMIILKNPTLLGRYIKCILVGLPTWFVVGQLVTLSPNYAKLVGVVNPPTTSSASVMWCYVGLVVGDLASGLSSHYLRSRRRALMIFVAIAALAVVYYLQVSPISLEMFYFKIFLMGFGMGYWALFVSVGAENFGTNIRATAATTIPNFARGMLGPVAATLGFFKNRYDELTATWIVFILIFSVTAMAVYFLDETFGKDLDYVDE
jgi:MFS transporter, putative metabolite:H+ symporter